MNDKQERAVDIERINRLICNSDDLGFLYAHSQNCAACEAARPAISSICKEHPSVEIETIDVDETPEAWEALGLRVVPSFLIVGKGAALVECAGTITLEKLRNAVVGARSVFGEIA